MAASENSAEAGNFRGASSWGFGEAIAEELAVVVAMAGGGTRLVALAAMLALLLLLLSFAGPAEGGLFSKSAGAGRKGRKSGARKTRRARFTNVSKTWLLRTLEKRSDHTVALFATKWDGTASRMAQGVEDALENLVS